MKMRMVEPDYFDGIQTDCIGDEDFHDILNFLDFPMEALEGDGLDGEWNGSESKFGPIPDALMGLPPMPQGNIGKGGSKVLPKPVAPSKVTEAQATAIFQTQSPVSVLESSSSCSGGKNISIKSDLVIPVRPRSKRAHSSAGNPWLLMDPMSSTTSASKKTNYAKKGKEKKRKLSHLSGAVKTLNIGVQHINDTLPQISDVTEKKTSTQQSHFVKKCTHCEITKTPQWREGPLGPKTLCNACGVRFRSGRLFPEYRPSASPTFVPSLHSNSHRKVLEMRKMSSCGAAAVEESHNVMMRRKRENFPEPVIVEDSPTSPEPEFVPRSSYLSDMY